MFLLDLESSKLSDGNSKLNENRQTTARQTYQIATVSSCRLEESDFVLIISTRRGRVLTMPTAPRP